MAKPTYNKTFVCSGTLNNECTTISYTYNDGTSDVTKEVDIAKSLAKFKGENIIFTIAADTSGESFEPDTNP